MRIAQNVKITYATSEIIPKHNKNSIENKKKQPSSQQWLKTMRPILKEGNGNDLLFKAI